MRLTHHCRLLLLGTFCLALAACAGPLGTVRVDPKVVYRDLARSAVATGEASVPTRNVLYERGLFDAFDKHPEDVIAELHRAMVAAGGTRTCSLPWPNCPSCTAGKLKRASMTWPHSSTPMPSSSPKEMEVPRGGSTPVSGSPQTFTTGR